MIVSNATPLIYLAKLGRLALLKDFFQEVIILVLHNLPTYKEELNSIVAAPISKPFHLTFTPSSARTSS